MSFGSVMWFVSLQSTSSVICLDIPSNYAVHMVAAAEASSSLEFLELLSLVTCMHAIQE